MTAKLESVSTKVTSVASSTLPVTTPAKLPPIAKPSITATKPVTLQTKPAETAKYTLPPGFTTENIQVGSEWMDRAAYNTLSPEDQSLIRKLGIEGFNKYQRTRYNDSQAAQEAAFYYRNLTGGMTSIDLIGFVNNERGTWYFKDGYIWVKPMLPTLFPKPDYKTSYKTVEEMLAGLGYADKDIQDIVAFNKDHVYVPGVSTWVNGYTNEKGEFVPAHSEWGAWYAKADWNKLTKDEQTRISTGSVGDPFQAGVAAGQLMSYSTGGMSKLAADVQAGLTTIKTASQSLGVSEAQLSTLVLLENYKTGDGYRLAEALNDGVNEKELVDLFGKTAVQDAQTQAKVLAKIGKRTLEQAIIEGALSPQDLLDLGVSEDGEVIDLAEAKRYISVTQAMSKLEGTKYKTADGYDLVGIIQDKKLSPGEVQLVFGPQPGDSTRVREEKAQTLSLARDMAHGKVKTPKGLAQSLWWGVTPWKEERGVSYLDYVTDAEGKKDYLKGVVAGELIAAQTVGPILLSLIPGAIAGTGAAIGGRAVATGVTLSRITGTGVSVAFAGMGAYGVHETVKHWDDMSPAQRTFNLSVAALAMWPALAGTKRALTQAQMGQYRIQAKQWTKSDVVAKGKPVKASEMVHKVLKGQESRPLGSILSQAEGRFGKKTYTLMKKNYGKPVADAWHTMTSSRNKLLDLYIQKLDLERGFKPLSERFRDIEWVGQKWTEGRRRSLGVETGESGLTKRDMARAKALDTKIRQMEVLLEAQTKRAFDTMAEAGSKMEARGKVAHLTREKLSAIDRDWAAIEETFRNPKDVVFDTKALAEAITGKTDIKALEADVAAAQKRLDAVRHKQGVSATTTFGDLVLDLAEKQIRLELARLGDVTKMQQLLGDINTALKTGRLVNGKPITQAQRVALKEAADSLAERIWSAAHSHTDPMIEAIYEDTPTGKRVVGYRTPQRLSSGGGSVLVAEPPVQTAPSVTPVQLRPQTRSVFAYAPAAGIGLMKVPAFREAVKPLVYDDVKRMVNPGEVSQTANLVMNAVYVGLQNKIAGANQLQIENAIENALIQELATSAELQAKLQLKLQTKLKVLTKVATKIAVKVKPKPKWFPPILPPPKGTTTSEAELEIPPGAAGWKQGAVYWHIWPENNELKKKATRKPVEGIPYKEGIGSAYASLRKTHGELPKLMGMDMGIMDVYIQGDQREPKMKVRQDLQRRTRLNLVEGNPSISRMK